MQKPKFIFLSSRALSSYIRAESAMIKQLTRKGWAQIIYDHLEGNNSCKTFTTQKGLLNLNWLAVPLSQGPPPSTDQLQVIHNLMGL
jgi:hypothetical protein